MITIYPETQLFADVIFGLFAFIWGLCIGSFANVCIYRMPMGRSIVIPRSHCPHCDTLIAWFDNIPLLSFVLLRGRCRACRERIAGRYFIIELLTGFLFFLIWRKYGLDFNTLIYWMVVAALIIGTFVDFDHMIIPDQITIGGIFAGLAISFIYPRLHGGASMSEGFKAAFIGMLVGVFSLWIVGELGRLAFKKDAMGMGDIKLLGAIGAFLGWQGVVWTIMVSSATGALAGLIMVLAGNKTMGSKIPFGPYIALAAVLWIVGGNDLWYAYLQWLHHDPMIP